ncbi:MAG TPA: tRNA (N6-threonylcarbamoyladenosine(37)-N6)-methyltransferase TrmO [Pseudobdellovibrionaceae bacterium]|nr:tRNA (N6-threonylcarbamoyladenosine(37)-N6)-methyltransferase TrmO [Pseudobdellovibrionaceae bacterium]
MELEPLGFIESCYNEKFGTPRQSGLVTESEGHLQIFSKFQPELALEGLERFSHVWLIWGFHKNENLRYHPKVHPPRLSGQSIGVFATRSPHRPNPLGLSLVKLTRVEAPRLYFQGLDLIQGTPIYDIKPYLPELESQPRAQGGWVDHVQNNPITVTFSPESQAFLTDWSLRNNHKIIHGLIQQTIALDPRPLVYRGFEGEADSPYRQTHVFSLFDLDIEFEFLDKTQALVRLVRTKI